MRCFFSPLFLGILMAGASFLGLEFSSAKDPVKLHDTRAVQKPKRSTLSELGIDFGAAELERYAELGLSGEQKEQALTVVKGRKPRIEKLCDLMAKALAMGEVTLEEKRIKELELAQILGQFKELQAEIIAGLHALVTKEQMAELEAIKKQERREELEASQRRAREVEAAG